MLQRLNIQNFALIDVLMLDFAPDLNIITGETGAGKSIILGALGLLNGERSQAQMVRDPSKPCTIQAIYDISNYGLEDFFKSRDLDFKSHTSIQREITSQGKSKQTINGKSCGVKDLQELSQVLIEIHSQHDSLELKSTEYQLQIVDAFAHNASLLLELGEMVAQRQKAKKELEILKENLSISQAEKELNQYHFQELSQYDFDTWDFEKLESDLNFMENSVEIQSLIRDSSQAILYDQVNIVDSLKNILIQLKKYAANYEPLHELNEQFENNLEELQDLAKEYDALGEKINFDEEELISAKERVDFINKMLVKHKVQTTQELMELRTKLGTGLAHSDSLNERIEELQSKLVELESNYKKIAKEITEKRKKAIPEIEQTILKYLSELKLDQSQFEILLETDQNQYTKHGMDTVSFLFSANLGMPLKELSKAISGGEMSRFALAAKSLIAQKMQLPTLIFDEIDTGVSGDVAFKVSETLARLSETHQVIAITHLPQIASRGDYHLYVYKSSQDQKTTTEIKKLSTQERVEEIAKMMSGDTITETALANARELLQN